LLIKTKKFILDTERVRISDEDGISLGLETAPTFEFSATTREAVLGGKNGF
jgi:hypothetical protein